MRLFRSSARADPHGIRLFWPDWEGMRQTILHQWSALVAEEMRYRPGFLCLPIAFGLGICLYFAASSEPELWAAPLLALCTLPVVLRAEGAWRIVAIGIMFMALGFAAASIRTYTVMRGGTFEGERVVTLTGFVETIETLSRRQRLMVRTHAIEGYADHALPYRLRIGISTRQGVIPGQFIRLRARIQPPSEAAMPGGYDFRRDAFFRSIGGVGYAFGTISLEAPPHPAPLDLRINAAVDTWRNALTERISHNIGGAAGALSAALVTGKRGTIPEETNDALRASGLYHIVSISGLHMVLAAGVFFWLVRAGLAIIPAIALRYPIKKIAALVAMGGATFYCIFSGSEVATERSLIMTLVMLGAILFDRPAIAMRNVAISALIVLAREPEALLGPSFQMSYAAVACLIAGNQIWREWRSGTVRQRPNAQIWPEAEKMAQHPSAYRKRETHKSRGFMAKMLIAFGGIVATTLIASLATAPFSAFHFHRLNPFGVLGNALAIPLVSLIVMPAAVAGTLLLPFGLDGFVWRIMGEGMRGVLLVAEKVAAFEQSSLPTPTAEPISFTLLVIALLVFVICRSSLRWGMVPILLLAFVLYKKTALPDLLVDPSARMVLIKGEGGQYRLLAAGSIQSFTLAQWLPALGDGRTPTDRTLKEDTRCDKVGCVGRLADGRSVALSMKPESLREDCTRADIIITPLVAPNPCRESKKVIDKAHLDQFGATMVLTPDLAQWQMKTSYSPQEERPWRKKAPARPDAAKQGDLPDQKERASFTSGSRPAAQAPSILMPGDDPGLMPDQ